MRPFFALTSVLIFVNLLPGQEAAKRAFADADREAAWQELFDGVTLKQCQVPVGSQIKDGTLIITGGPNSKLQITAPLGDRFKVLIECRADGPSMPSLLFETRTLFSHGATGGTMSGKVGEWAEFLLVGNTAPGSRAGLDAFDRKVGDQNAHGSGQFGGEGRPTVSLDVPAGTTLTIRRIRLQTTAAPADPTAGLFIALVVLVLGFLLLGVLGWLLHRRQSAKAPGPPAS